jgi:16S rRNA (guanine966-N2)-methyltransferase
MRVIAGSAKGVRLAPVPSGVRPVSDMAREGIFSSLGDDVSEARVLDLYAGTGAMGIEALSRGAARACFVDRSRAAQRAIRENLRRAAVTDRAEVVASGVAGFLGREGERDRFDLVFADPPYVADPDEIDHLLDGLAGGWLAAGWTVVLTRPSRGSGAVRTPDRWETSRRLAYGDTAVVIYRATPLGGSTGVPPLSFK